MIHPGLPYYQAILSFNRAKNVYVPNDMLYCFIEGLRLINNAASDYKYKNDIIEYEMKKSVNKANKNLDTIDEKEQIDQFEYNGVVDDIDAMNKQEDDMISIIKSHSASKSPVEREYVQFSADDLFPILVWIIVHCRINDIHMRLGYLQKFLDDSIKYFGEVGMCLSLVQAAAEFVRKKEGWHFGLDEELDKDKLNIVKNDNNDGNDDTINIIIKNGDDRNERHLLLSPPPPPPLPPQKINVEEETAEQGNKLNDEEQEMRDRMQFYEHEQASAVDIPLPMDENQFIFELPPMPEPSDELLINHQDIQYLTKKYENKKRKSKKLKGDKKLNNIPDFPADFIPLTNDINVNQNGEVEM